MQVAERIVRLRRHAAATATSQFEDTTQGHTDFTDFSENTGPGDREPSFEDFVDKN